MDNHSKSVRSYNMSRIRSTDNKPEEIVRKYLFAQGFRYRKNDNRYPGKPDILLPKYKTAIFVNEPDEPQVVILDENDTCLVPSEVLRGNGNYIYVSVFADSLITANRTKVFVEPSGYTGDVEDMITPTPSVYWQLIEMYEQLQDDMQHIDGGTFEDWREG